MKQKLGLCCALIHDPDLLILDEPTSGVDPVARDQFWELLIKLSREKGVTIFISTHFMNEAQRCDRISLMHDGTTESRNYLENFTGSRYFRERPPIRDYDDLDRRMESGELRVAVEIPPNFGKDLKRGRSPEVSVWIDGAMPSRGETMRGYLQGLHRLYLSNLQRGSPTAARSSIWRRRPHSESWCASALKTKTTHRRDRP